MAVIKASYNPQQKSAIIPALMGELMALSADEMAALQAYSDGKIGWRAACKSLTVVDHHELHELLDAHDLPEPAADEAPLSDDTVARFSALLKGEG